MITFYKKNEICIGTIEEAIEWVVECGEGWIPLIREYLTEACKLGPVTIHQIKEKFGGLRLYVSIDSNKVPENFTHSYEKRADKICEYCGETGYLNSRSNSGWTKTLCSKCATEHNYQAVEEYNEDEEDLLEENNKKLWK